MKNNRLILLLCIAVAATLLSACGGRPAANNWPGLVADPEKAYVASGSFIYAVNLEDGSEAWHYPSKVDGKRQFFTALALTPDGQLLAGSAGSEHVFISLDPATGEENWASSLNSAQGIWLAPPLALDGIIYAPNSDGRLYVLKTDGEFVESVDLGGALWSQPVSDGGLIYVASLDHHLHVINPSSRKILHTVDLGGAIPGSPTPTTDGTGVYVGSFTGKMEFITVGGDRSTLFEAEDWIWGGPALDGDTLYFADLGGRVYSLDLASGRRNWGEVQPDGPVAASPLLMADKIIIVTESGSVYAFDRDGREAWPKAYATGGKIYTSPVASGELILIAPYQAESLLAALDADGKQAWLFAPQR